MRVNRQPKTMQARSQREARFALLRAQGMTPWQAVMELGLSSSATVVYERRRLEAAVGKRAAA